MSNFLIDEDTDLLAAEFVLGTLDSEERAIAQSSLRTNHGFIAMVRIWERRFGELHLMVEPVEPDAKIFQRIKAKIAEIAPREPLPEGKLPLATMPSPEPPAGLAAVPTPVEGATAGEGRVPEGAAADGAPPPAAPLAAGEVTAPAPEAAESVAADGPGPEPRPGDTPLRLEEGATAKSEILVPPAVTPPPVVEPAEQPPDHKVEDQRPDRRPDRPQEVTLGLIRSRRRWRALGLVMMLLAIGLGALLAAWRVAPDRLPVPLRPAEVMTSLGIQPAPRAAPAPRPVPPESQFDE